MGKVIQGRFKKRRILDINSAGWKWFILPLLGTYLLVIFEVIYFIMKGK